MIANTICLSTFYFILYRAGFTAAALITGILLFALIFFGYIPLTGLFGGWDDTTLSEFGKVALMYGHSKIFTAPIYRILEFVAGHSKLHNRFGMPTEHLIEDLRDLTNTKLKRREEFKTGLGEIGQ